MPLRQFVALAAAGAVVTWAAVTAFGYWHAATHATLAVQLAYKQDSGTLNRMRNGQVEFLDDNHAVLARATIDTRHSVVWLAHPDKGQCGPDLARDTSLECFQAQALWIPQWVRGVRYVNVTLERCSLAHKPVQLATRRDNLLLWWLPLPHRGRLPYTRYSATFAVDTRGCQ